MSARAVGLLDPIQQRGLPWRICGKVRGARRKLKRKRCSLPSRGAALFLRAWARYAHRRSTPDSMRPRCAHLAFPSISMGPGGSIGSLWWQSTLIVDCSHPSLLHSCAGTSSSDSELGVGVLSRRCHGGLRIQTLIAGSLPFVATRPISVVSGPPKSIAASQSAHPLR